MFRRLIACSVFAIAAVIPAAATERNHQPQTTPVVATTVPQLASQMNREVAATIARLDHGDDEPRPYALLIAGLGAIGLMVLRRSGR